MSRWPPPPHLAAAFYKAHGLGNDYLVFEEAPSSDRGWTATPGAVQRVCAPHEGVGSDGIVALLADRSGGVFRLRMFNPDGSEFERSGNGLRVLASYLESKGLVGTGEDAWFDVEVGGSRVRMCVHGNAQGVYDISVEMGRARVGPEAVELRPGALDARGRLAGPGGEPLHVVPVSVGNPHLVVLVDTPTTELLAEIGPFLVAHPALAHGANVQLARVASAGTTSAGTTRAANACDALIWERGVGPTSASGTSACAVAVALVSQGRLPPGEVTVRMPGGAMSVTVDARLEVVLRGPVEGVCTGVLSGRLLARSGP
ncbi:MAG: diaminopimelate epimerase [Gemmatimonadetes bacterium]|nr:diaminopimelate epimerase [Gemmatimonadota bacterium]